MCSGDSIDLAMEKAHRRSLSNTLIENSILSHSYFSKAFDPKMDSPMTFCNKSVYSPPVFIDPKCPICCY
ncbi:hypothetical protein F0562_033621 [Nyssa sinensis]|uniref:Uncharacterized protein n=1 Tax=Nyssa sinensis TaxID=561372 RepID=A0A5J5AID3_9ASTE|nr:hypothetical protein F0562_033621 [Nyssa sinensis]